MNQVDNTAAPYARPDTRLQPTFRQWFCLSNPPNYHTGRYRWEEIRENGIKPAKLFSSFSVKFLRSCRVMLEKSGRRRRWAVINRHFNHYYCCCMLLGLLSLSATVCFLLTDIVYLQWVVNSPPSPSYTKLRQTCEGNKKIEPNFLPNLITIFFLDC